jgi:hypothetical protein
LFISEKYWWTITPYSDYSLYVRYVSDIGNLSNFTARNSGGVRPVLYLKSSINLKGNGTAGNPYIIVSD